MTHAGFDAKPGTQDLTPSTPLVRQLLRSQFHEWSELPIKAVASSGTDNALFRLGDDLVVRLPLVPHSAEQVAKEQRWLPALGPSLPLATPEPVAMGVGDDDYPFAWSVYRWLNGETASLDRIDDQERAAHQLGTFVRILRGLEPTGGPTPGDHNSHRGVPLIERDQRTREAIGALSGHLDVHWATRTWESALEVPPWKGAPTWIHGDLHSENLLASEGRLSAVIDFGCLGVGDPACDAMPGWLLFDADNRPTFRESAGFDDATWDRGRGWALSLALIVLPHYRNSNPALVAIAERAVHEVLHDGHT